MTFEELSPATIDIATTLLLELWPDEDFEEEKNNCQRILHTQDESIFLVKTAQSYVGFIYLNLRREYVEGTSSSPVAYIEGIYLRPAYQQQGIGKQLVDLGEQWGKERGASEYASDAELTNVGSIAFHKQVGFTEANRVVCFSKKI